MTDRANDNLTASTSWREDGSWLELGSAHCIADPRHNLRVFGGVSDDEDPEDQEPLVLLSMLCLDDGDHSELEISSQAARELGLLLLQAADEADAQMTLSGKRLTIDERMENMRADHYRREARRK